MSSIRRPVIASSSCVMGSIRYLQLLWLALMASLSVPEGPRTSGPAPNGAEGQPCPPSLVRPDDLGDGTLTAASGSESKRRTERPGFPSGVTKRSALQLL